MSTIKVCPGVIVTPVIKSVGVLVEIKVGVTSDTSVAVGKPIILYTLKEVPKAVGVILE